MNVLVLGLYAEGRTDERFLPIVIQRTSQRLLDAHDRMNVDAQEPIVIKKLADISRLDQCILQAAREACEYDALIIHSDGDDRGYKQTLLERFNPGNQLVQESNEDVCRQLLPIIPIRMVEAWMLADPDALQAAMKTQVKLHNLGVPIKARLVEAETYPKETVKQAVQKAYPKQPKVWNAIMSRLYTELAPIISLERLEQVPSYQQFVRDLTATFRKLNLIQ